MALNKETKPNPILNLKGMAYLRQIYARLEIFISNDIVVEGDQKAPF